MRATMSDWAFRWSAIDASEVVDKEGSRMIIPIKDAMPVEPEEDLQVRVFIDNIMVLKTDIEHEVWTDVQVIIPEFVKDKFTLTLVFNRSWSPKELDLNDVTPLKGLDLTQWINKEKDIGGPIAGMIAAENIPEEQLEKISAELEERAKAAGKVAPKE